MKRRWGGSLVSILAALAVLAALATEPNLRRRTALASLAADARRAILHQPYAPSDADQPLQCWGDSLTAGAGATFGHDYPSLLRSVFHRPALNEGVGGETSSAIRTRMLGRRRDGHPEAVVIWAGRNNLAEPQTVEADIEAMVASLAPGSRYLVLEIIRGGAAADRSGGRDVADIAALNAALERRHGPHFVRLEQAFLDHADRRLAEDRQDVADGVVPGSLRADAIHLNDMGQAVVAYAVDAALRAPEAPSPDGR